MCKKIKKIGSEKKKKRTEWMCVKIKHDHPLRRSLLFTFCFFFQHVDNDKGIDKYSF